MRRAILSICAPAAVALAVAGCGGGSGGGTATAKPTAAARAAIATAPSGLGRILVNAQHRTLYLFEKDRGAMSACSGACASVWPPATTTGKPVAGPGAVTAKLGTIRRSDGTTQITYGGHPLYGYVGDAKAGDLNGQGLNQFGAEWYVLSPAGHKIEHGS